MRAEPAPRRQNARLMTGAVVGFLSLTLTLASCGSESGGGDADPKAQSFVTRPDLAPPEIEFTEGEAWDGQYAESDEYFFISPGYPDDDEPDHGAGIYDAQGELVWMQPSDPEADTDNFFDIRAQEFQGEPVLSYYRGDSHAWGYGEITMLDDAYEELTTVTTGDEVGEQRADFHDTTITDEGTMLLGSYHPTPMDLSAVGGPEDGWGLDGLIQEVDIETGEVVFEWSAAEHVPVDSTYKEQAESEDAGTEDDPLDWFHINSITEDDDGNLLVSARNTHAVYKIDRETGDLIWTLGGKNSDFEMGEDAQFRWQHDAHRAPDGTITLLDNHVDLDNADGQDSRGLRLALDEEAMTAEVDQEYDPPKERPAGSMANMQELDNGNVIVGWGQEPYFSEYTNDGELIYDAAHGGDGSYRAYKLPWEGNPTTDPDVVVEDGNVYASWNGATEVAEWRVVAGDDEGSAEAVTTVERDGFETEIPLEQDAEYVAVEALDENGEVLATGTPEG